MNRRQQIFTQGLVDCSKGPKIRSSSNISGTKRNIIRPSSPSYKQGGVSETNFKGQREGYVRDLEKLVSSPVAKARMRDERVISELEGARLVL